MNYAIRPFRVCLALTLWLLLPASIFSQSTSSGQSPVLLEIIFTVCTSDCDHDTTRVYADGRYVSEAVFREKSKSGRFRQVSTKTEKQLDAEELAELVKLAEQPDFLNARLEYVVTIVRDSPGYITITYRNKGRDKKVTVSNLSLSNAEEKAKLPPTVLELMKWVHPYSFQ